MDFGFVVGGANSAATQDGSASRSSSSLVLSAEHTAKLERRVSEPSDPQPTALSQHLRTILADTPAENDAEDDIEEVPGFLEIFN